MKKACLILCVIGILGTPILGQSPEKIAALSKKVVGKWMSIDKTSYIEFRPDGTCSAGELGRNGKWEVEENKIGMWQQGNDFICGSGALSFTGPNTIARDYGMGGKPIIYHRVATGAPADAGNVDRFVIHTAKGDVAVLDFRKHPALITADKQTIELEDKNNYQIVFNVADTSFVLAILVKPFPVVRKVAEAAFLKDLGISQSDACKLGAYEGMTIHVDPHYAGRSYGLSFCPGTLQPAAR